MQEGIKHICFIVPNYPTYNDPVYTFVRELVYSITEQGIKCTVIAPQSISNFILKRRRKRPYHWQDITENNKKIDVFQPIHAPFLNFSIFGVNLSGFLTERTVRKTFKKKNIQPDVLYAHFWHSGVIAGGIGIENNLPVFVASGESKIWVNNLYSRKTIKSKLIDIRGVVCVSEKNKQESIELGLASEEKSIVIPNAINNQLFYKLDKQKVRKKLGFNEADFIIAYTGAFSHRKGVMRLSKAIQEMDDVKTIYIGSGSLKPNTDNTLFIGKLPHYKINEYLNAADIFVLPTLAEGCCNAIIEAMACGLPIISSNGSFNDDILNNSNSIRVDPNNTEEINKAINTLKKNYTLRKEMSRASLLKAADLEINNRAKKIIKFINSKNANP